MKLRVRAQSLPEDGAMNAAIGISLGVLIGGFLWGMILLVKVVIQ